MTSPPTADPQGALQATAEQCEAACLHEADERIAARAHAEARGTVLTREQRMIGALLHAQGVRLGTARSHDGRLLIRWTTPATRSVGQHRRSPARRSHRRSGSRRSRCGGSRGDPDEAGDPEPVDARSRRYWQTAGGSDHPKRLRERAGLCLRLQGDARTHFNGHRQRGVVGID